MSPPRSIRTSSVPSSTQALRAGQQVGRVTATADGVDREVLEEQQAVADASRPPLVGELVLELPRRPVRHRAEVLDGEHPAVRGEERMLVTGGPVRGVTIRDVGAPAEAPPPAGETLMSRKAVTAP